MDCHLILLFLVTLDFESKSLKNDGYGLFAYSLEDYDVDEEDEEALIEQRRLQRLAIVQVRFLPYNWPYLSYCDV